MASAAFRVCSVLIPLVLTAVFASAQATVNALRVNVGVTGSVCTVHSGTGAPAAGLGAVCDTYIRKDSPYTISVKTAASTWSEIYRAGGTDVAVADGGTGLSSYTTGDVLYASGATTIAGRAAVASGQVLTSAGTSTAPVYSATPAVTSLTASGAVQGATVTGTTSMTTPTLTASANLTLSPAGDIITAPTGLDILPGVGYTTNIGMLTNKYLTLHAAELWVETLVAQNTIATIGGRILVGPTTTLTSDLAAADTTMYVKHNQMQSGDRVVLQVDGSLEWLAVTGSAGGGGPYSYTIARNQDGSGANVWTAGDAVFNSGTTGNGFIDLYSVAGVVAGSTAGPTIVGNVRLSNTFSDIAPRWAIGNLNGTYGYGVTTYGAAFGDNDNAWVKIDPTNGVRIGRAGTTNFQVDAAGNATFVGNGTFGGSVTVGSGGRNQITNSQMMRFTAAGFALSSDGVSWSTGTAPGADWGAEGVGGTSGLGYNQNCALASWFVNGSGSCYFQMIGTPSVGTHSNTYGPAYPVTAGDTYEFSFFCGNHRGAAVNAEITWYNAANTNLSTSQGANGTCSDGAKLGGTTWDTWGRAFVIAVAPAGAVRGHPNLRQYYPGAQLDPFLFYTRLYFGQATTGQTTASPWSAAGISQITGEHFATDMVIANTIRSSGATALGTGTGYWLDATSTPTFRVGVPGGNEMKWDGTNLTIKSANFTTSSSGTAIIPSTVFSDARGYVFSTTTGSLGLYAADPDGSGRAARVQSTWTGVGNYNLGPALIASIYAANLPSSGGTNLSASVSAHADTSSTLGFVSISASNYVQFDTDLRIFTNNGTSTTIPYMRSNGNFLVIESRSNANGGAIYMSNDNAADIIMGFAGGRQTMYGASFVSTAPRWANALTQLTIGANGAAAALTANPAAYLHVADAAGNVFIVPAYNP